MVPLGCEWSHDCLSCSRQEVLALTTAGNQGTPSHQVPRSSGLLHVAALGFLQERKSQMRETSGTQLQQPTVTYTLLMTTNCSVVNGLLESKLLMVINYILWRILPIWSVFITGTFIHQSYTDHFIPSLLDHLPTLSKLQEKQWGNCS